MFSFFFSDLKELDMKDGMLLSCLISLSSGVRFGNTNMMLSLVG